MSSFQLATVLKGGLRASRLNAILRKILVMVQFSISIFIIIGTGIVYNQLKYIQNKELGFNIEQVVVLPLTDPRVRQIYLTYKNRVFTCSNFT